MQADRNITDDIRTLPAEIFQDESDPDGIEFTEAV
jgi:hypothetical protein